MRSGCDFAEPADIGTCILYFVEPYAASVVKPCMPVLQADEGTNATREGANLDAESALARLRVVWQRSMVRANRDRRSTEQTGGFVEDGRRRYLADDGRIATFILEALAKAAALQKPH